MDLLRFSDIVENWNVHIFWVMMTSISFRLLLISLLRCLKAEERGEII